MQPQRTQLSPQKTTGKMSEENGTTNGTTKYRLPGLYGNTDLGSRITMFQDKAEKHKEKQKLNPFSGSFDAVASAKLKLNKEDPNYGKPVEGSKTDLRGKQAAQSIANEIKLLVEIIQKHGIVQESSPNKEVTITFKELFELYKVISSKVVGLLLRARKHGLVKFEGEMLYQGRDDNVIITLDPTIKPEDYLIES